MRQGEVMRSARRFFFQSDARNCLSMIVPVLRSAGAKAIERMEQLRSKSFASLAAGGSLSSNVTNYFDASDPRFVVRWTVANNATPPTKKTITVRAQAVRRVVGLRKEAQVTTVRAK